MKYPYKRCSCKAVIDYIRSLREHTCAVQSVLGNHEWMLLRSLASE